MPAKALATIIVSLAADRVRRRQSLLVLSLLTGIGGLALALSPALTVLLTTVFVGMLNGCFFCPRPSHCSETGPGFQENNLAGYNVLFDGGGSLAALAAGLPLFLQHRLSFSHSVPIESSSSAIPGFA